MDTPPILSSRLRRPAHADDGVTLVELMVAITVLMIIMAGIAAGATSGLRLARGNTNRIVAANVADEQIGEVRAMDFADIPQTTTTGTTVRGAVTYTWTQTAEMVYLGADESCEAPPGAFNANELSYLRVVVEVAWPTMDGINPVRSETLIDPPVADYDPYLGHLAVKVTDRDGAPVSGMTVYLKNADAATPGGSRFESTDDSGCAFFENLKVISGDTVGHYYVWLDKPGWVDRASGLSDTSAQSPQPIVDVVSAQLRKIEFNYDEAANLSVALVGRFGGTPLSGLPVTIANDNYNGGNGPVVFASTGALAAAALHPFPSGFSLWAGRCTDADPGPDDRTRLPTDPNTTTTGDVVMGTIDFAVYRRILGTTYPVSGATVQAEDGCGNTFTSPVKTDGSGSVTVALPFGQWTLRAVGTLPRTPSSWPTVTVAPNDTAAGTIQVRVW